MVVYSHAGRPEFGVVRWIAVGGDEPAVAPMDRVTIAGADEDMVCAPAGSTAARYQRRLEF